MIDHIINPKHGFIHLFSFLVALSLQIEKERYIDTIFQYSANVIQIHISRIAQN